MVRYNVSDDLMDFLTKLAEGITVKELFDACGSDADNVCGLVNSLEIIENSCIILDSEIRADNAHYIDGRPIAYDSYMGYESYKDGDVVDGVCGKINHLKGFYLQGHEDVGGRGQIVRTYLKMNETVRML